jgi:Flp pilus assembly protein TadG
MKYKSEKGQAMVEFALVLIPLLMILGGIIDFGWVFHQQVMANNASREAARHIAVHYNIDSMTTTTVNTAANTVTNNSIPDYISFAPPTVGDGIVISTDDVSVTVDWETTTFMPFFSKLIGTITIDSTTVMKLE